MKILITGGAGFIGSNVADGYVREGHDVVIVDNLSTGKFENLNPGAKFYLCDVRSRELARILEIEKPDVINHHAAQMSVPASVEDPAFDASVNILGLINLLEGARTHRVRKVIFISTGGAIYGEAETLPTPEKTTPVPLSPYAITKLASEKYLNFYHHQHGLDFTVLRYANIYGPRQVPHAEAGVVAIFMDQLAGGKVPAIFHYEDEPDGMTRDYCFVKDIVEANLQALDKADNEILNLGTSTETTTGELYRTVLHAMRENGVATQERFDAPHKGPARGGDLRRSCLDASLAARVLAWSPAHDLKQGIQETVTYYLNRRG